MAGSILMKIKKKNAVNINIVKYRRVILTKFFVIFVINRKPVKKFLNIL